MKFLKWYSAVIVTFSILSLAIELTASQTAYETQVNLWGITMFVPVAVYLWIKCLKRGAEK